MRLPSLLVIVAAALAIGAPTAAQAGPDAYVPPGLPPNLSARADHVPKPMPEDGDLEFQRSGPGGWAVAAGFFVGAAATAGVVSGVEHARMKRTDDPSVAESARKGRNAAGYTALGSVGAAGVCLVLNQVW